MERKRIEKPAVRRVMLTDAARGAVVLQRELWESVPQAGLELSDWVSDGSPPPCAGIWEYKVLNAEPKQGGGEGFLWFMPALGVDGAQDGTWHGIRPDGKPGAMLAWHHNYRETMIWRGLKAPHPDGYRYFVEGGKRYRVRLEVK